MEKTNFGNRPKGGYGKSSGFPARLFEKTKPICGRAKLAQTLT